MKSEETDMKDDTARAAKVIPEIGESQAPRKRRLRVFQLMERRYWLLIAVLLGVLGLAIYLLWPSGSATNSSADGTATVVSVRVAKAERGSIAAEVSGVGSILPRYQATVSATINAQIKHMPLLRNKPVRAGAAIAILESRDIQAQRAEAAAALEEARLNARMMSSGTIPETTAQDEKAFRDARARVANALAIYGRRRTLYEQGGLGKKDLDDSQLALTTAENELRIAESSARLHAATTNPNNRALSEARVKQAQDRLAALDTQLSYATIRAPFSGIITEQFQFEGEYAAAGAKLFTIADLSEVIVKASFADTVAAQLQVGDPATVWPQDLSGQQMSDHISLVSRASDPQNRTVEVWVNLKNPTGTLRAAAAARVVVTTKTATDAIVVPSSAVTLDTTNGTAGTVMVVDADSVAHEQKVTVGIQTTDRMQIASGLQGGETVVVEGNYALPDGTTVQVNESGAAEASQGTAP